MADLRSFASPRFHAPEGTCHVWIGYPSHWTITLSSHITPTLRQKSRRRETQACLDGPLLAMVCENHTFGYVAVLILIWTLNRPRTLFYFQSALPHCLWRLSNLLCEDYANKCCIILGGYARQIHFHPVRFCFRYSARFRKSATLA